MGTNGKPGRPMTPEQRAKLPLTRIFAICRQQAHADFGGQDAVDYTKRKLREAYAAEGLDPSEEELEFTAHLFVDSAKGHVKSVRAKQQRQWDEIARRNLLIAKALDDYSKSAISKDEFLEEVDAVVNGERDKMIANALENSSTNGISNDDFHEVVETVVNGKTAKYLMANPLKKKDI